MKKPKLKTCKICTGEFTPFSSTARVCSWECANEWNRQKDIKARDKKVRAEVKDFKWSNVKDLKDKAQAAFNAFIRYRDRSEPCISCQRYHAGQYHAGHFKTVGARGDLRFNEDNCHKQCAPCNNHLSGNIGEYMPNLIKKIGQDRFDALARNRNKKYSVEILRSITIEYKEKLKLLKYLNFDD